MSEQKPQRGFSSNRGRTLDQRRVHPYEDSRRVREDSFSRAESRRNNEFRGREDLSSGRHHKPGVSSPRIPSNWDQPPEWKPPAADYFSANNSVPTSCYVPAFATPFASNGGYLPEPFHLTSPSGFWPEAKPPPVLLSDAFPIERHELLWKVLCLRYACGEGDPLPSDWRVQGPQIYDALFSNRMDVRYRPPPSRVSNPPFVAAGGYDPLNPQIRN